MGILGDFKEVKKDWKQMSSLLKIVTIISLFMTVSSITSLADTIVQWKGFIREGIYFYQTYFNYPLQRLSGFIGVSYTSQDIDKIVIFSLIYSTGIRYIYLEYKCGELSKTTFFIGEILAILFYSFSLFTLAIDTPGEGFFILMGALLAFVYWTIKWFGNINYKKALWIPVIAISVVLILAAINKGLSA